MSRVQLALNVDNLDEAVRFYSKLFNTEPSKLKDGYANFAITEPPLKLVLLENPGSGGTINHLGVEVESSDTVHSEIARLSGEGLFTDEEIGTTCCFATQDKVWVTGPAGKSGRSTPSLLTPTPLARVRSISIPQPKAACAAVRKTTIRPFPRRRADDTTWTAAANRVIYWPGS